MTLLTVIPFLILPMFIEIECFIYVNASKYIFFYFFKSNIYLVDTLLELYPYRNNDVPLGS